MEIHPSSLLHNGIIVDALGWEKSFVADGWDIAGVPNALAGYSIVREENVTSGIRFCFLNLC
jgi:hypothetical protein